MPVIVDHAAGGEPTTVFDSGAILIYLAEKTGSLLPASGRKRYDAHEWMIIQLTGIGPPFGQYIHFARFASGSNEYGRDRYRSETVRLLDVLESRLSTHEYLGGDTYSIPDLATYPRLSMLELIGLPADYSSVKRWRSLVAARPTVRRLEAKVQELAPQDKASRKAATVADLERMFDRGDFQRS